MKRTTLMLPLTLLIGLVQPAFGQLTSQESLSGFRLGMTGKEVSALMRQKTDRVAVPTDKGRITVGHSYYPPDLSVKWLGETGTAAEGYESKYPYGCEILGDGKDGLDDCSARYSVDYPCGRPVSCTNDLYEIDFRFFNDSATPWLHNIATERLVGISFHNKTDDKKEEKSQGTAHEDIFQKYEKEAVARFHDGSFQDRPFADKLWWLSPETYDCPGEWTSWKGEKLAGKDARYEYRVQYVHKYYVEVWLFLIDRKNFYTKEEAVPAEPAAGGQFADQLDHQQISSGQDSPITISPAQAQALLVNKVEPDYPILARQARIEGTVTLDAVIGKDGAVRSLSVASGHPLLVPAAIAAVKQWRYKPYESSGEPSDVTTQVVVTFAMSSGPQPLPPPSPVKVAPPLPPNAPLEPPQAMIDYVRTLLEVNCHENKNRWDAKVLDESSCVDERVNSERFRRLQFKNELAPRSYGEGEVTLPRPLNEPTDYGWLVEFYTDGCEAKKDCLVLFVVFRPENHQNWWVSLSYKGTLQSPSVCPKVFAAPCASSAGQEPWSGSKVALSLNGHTWIYAEESGSYWDADEYAKERKQEDAKEEAETKAADQKVRAAFLTLGLHSGQSQAQVKQILLQQGFSPWQCDSSVMQCVAPWRCGTDNAGTIQCASTRGKTMLLLFFSPTGSRDQDTGRSIITGRVLVAVGFNVGESSIAFGLDTKW
jgi:TonB family protein